MDNVRKNIKKVLKEYDEEEKDPEEEGDIRTRRRPNRAVHKPTAADILEHSRTHIPYRVWCPYCVAGRGRRRKHATAEEDPQQAP